MIITVIGLIISLNIKFHVGSLWNDNCQHAIVVHDIAPIAQSLKWIDHILKSIVTPHYIKLFLMNANRYFEVLAMVLYVFVSVR